MPRTKTAVEFPVTYTGNVVYKSVKICFDTGLKSSSWPYPAILVHYEVSENKGGSRPFSYRRMSHEKDPLANWQSRDQAVRDLSEEIVAKAESMVLDLRKQYDKTVEKGRKSWQYKMLEAFAKKLGLPTHWQEDLTVHDAYSLAFYNPSEWIGSIREAGTWIWCKESGDSRDWRRSEVKNASRDTHYYHATRKGIREITADQYQAWKL